MHSLHQSQIFSATHSVENYVDYANDGLSLMDLSINVPTSTIQMPLFVSISKAQENYQVLNPPAENPAGECLNTKLAMLTAGRVSFITPSEYESQTIEGIELPCCTTGIPFRKKVSAIRFVPQGCPLGGQIAQCCTTSS